MLDAETKAKIDSARDILVGKVPDPKSQVEQITIALIYKFMDDMDRQSEELGGKATFFTGDFKKYRWAQLLDKRFSGHERLSLYAEGLDRMNINKNIPQLFRDIFKSVFLPYRDPETLNLFLKEIDGFTYEHSERLGDAFEYLLSVLGTQGDAGQFRTPRHIIHFIAAVVDPKKTETVLDPACGTAGFLISAYKHILKANENLTPDERARLMSNFRGYDIAPDMVRLSRVNLYLHGFPNPVIHEYDTLTSEERWDERCDVILANPPFMTPKGGIRPHNRFSIKAKRSEVLFVDYIAEHLNPGGRAGVIVPEGIIFQSQNAYKSLRKMLVENYLWAVVSLPAGVFNPYSGVKTSILFLDRNLAKRTDEVLFVKVENDGFDLGAQRRPIEGGQLAEALEILNGHKKAQKAQEGKMALTVSRKRILQSPDCNLSGDRYRTAAIRGSGKWPMVKLEEVCDLIGGGTPSKTEKRFWTNGTVKWLSAKHINEYDAVVSWDLITREAVKQSATNIIPSNAVVVVTRVSVGKMTLLNEPMAVNQDLTGLVVRDQAQLIAPFLFWTLKRCASTISDSAQGLGVKGVTRQYMSNIEIPLPPLDEQDRIVAELEAHRKVIEGARQILASYKPIIRVDPEWPLGKLGPYTSLVSSGVTPLGGKDNYLTEGVLFIRSQNILKGCCDFSDAVFISETMHKQMIRTHVQDHDVLLNITGASIGRCAVFKEKEPANVNQHVCIIRLVSERLNFDFLCAVINSDAFQTYIMQIQSGASRQALNFQQIRDFDIPLPSLDIQRKIVAELEAERKLVEASRELIARMEAKIQAKLAEVWGEETIDTLTTYIKAGGNHG
jgi:type I restriction enzyme M protein